MTSEQRRRKRSQERIARAERRKTERTQQWAEGREGDPIDAWLATRGFSRKLDRALTHIEALDKSIERWLNSGAYLLVEETDTETGDQLLVPKITKPPSDEWPLIIGDAIHNLRAALDQLVYALALREHQTTHPGQPLPEEIERRLQFPIIAISRDESRTVEEVYLDAANRQLQGVPIDAATRIQGLQPYHGANPLIEPLNILNDLDIIDKHRRLHAVVIAPAIQEFQLGGGDMYVKKFKANNAPVKHNTPILRYTIRATSSTPVQMQGRFARAIALGEGPPAIQQREVVGMLLELRQHILDNVLPPLVDFLR
jgi:hypothetical protein